jgi:hypothetical protein
MSFGIPFPTRTAAPGRRNEQVAPPLIPLLTRAWARAFPGATVGLIAANVARELLKARRPQAAAGHLAELRGRRPTRPQRELYEFLARRARALQAQGALELE